MDTLYDIEVELLATIVVSAAGALLLALYRGPIRRAVLGVLELLGKKFVRNIRGTWKATVSHPHETFTQTLTIQQRVSTVWGTISCERFGYTYRFTGELVFDTLSGEFGLLDPKGLHVSGGSFILVLESDLRSMNGAFLSHVNSELFSASYSLSRVV